MKAILTILCLSILVCTASGGTLLLVADTTTPEPNDEITVWVHATDPLFFLDMRAYVVGDATILSAMSETDCDEYGWDISFNPTPTIDPEGWVHIGGICWAADADGVVGYFTFRYNSGQVAVFIDQENTTAFHWNGGLAISETTLWFGDPILPEPQEPNEPEHIFLECPPIAGGSPRNSGGESFGSGRVREISELSRNGLYSQLTLVEVDSDITTNQVWTSDNVYYITEQTVNVQALLVIEPGTLIIFGQDCAMFINNDGTLISRGSPDNLITYTCDYLYFYYPEEIGTYWYDLYYTENSYYYSPIYIEETASPSTTITYSFIEGAAAGIVTKNIRLDHPIENNYLFANIYGIYEFGPKLTDIKNNLFFHSDESAIEVHLADGNGAADSNSFIAIENNTCDFYQYCGISIHGVADENDAGTVVLANNIVSGAYWYGLNLVDGHMLAIVANTGYYDNGINKNWAFDEYDPVQATQDPYTSGTLLHESHFLDQASPFIDAGAVYIDQTRLIGMTTDVNSQPDSGLVDIGFHYPNWGFSNAGIGLAETDFNRDGITGYEDLFVLTSQWLESVTPGDEGDLNNDGVIDLEDFALFSAAWQKIQGNPDISASIEISNEDGSIDVQVQNHGQSIYQYFVLIDGLYAKELMFSDGLFQRNIYMPWLSPGLHEARIIGAGEQGITCSIVIPFEINNAIGPCVVPQIFEQGKPLPFFANSGVDVRVSAWVSGQEVWSQSYPSGMVQGAVPAAVTDENDIEFLLIEPAEQFAGMSAGAGASPVAVPVVSADDDSGEYTALMIRPYFKINFVSGLADYVHDKLVEMGYKVKKLRFYNSSFKNVKKYIDRGTIKVLYYNGHGNYVYPNTDIKRSVLGLDDCNIVSDKVSNYHPGQAPSWLEPLPPAIEANVKTWRELNLKDLKFAAFDACKAMMLRIDGQGKLVESPNYNGIRGDLSAAVLQRPTSVPCFVFGWAPDFESGTTSPWQGFSIDMWKKLAEGKTLAEAISYAYGRAPADVRNGHRLQGNGDPFGFDL